MSLSITEIEHRKIEPITKHLFPLQDKRSSWPDKIQLSEKNYKAIIIKHEYVFIDLFRNSEFFGSQQTHRKIKSYIIWIPRDHCIEKQNERESHLTTAYGPIGLI